MKSWLLLSLFCYVSIASASSWRNYTDSNTPLYEASFSGSETSSHKQFRTVTINLHYSQHIDELIKFIKAHDLLKDADAFLLQEVVGEPGNHSSHSAHKIASALKLNYAYVPAFIHKENEKDFGVAILSPHPLSDAKKIILPHPHFLEKTQRVAVGVTVHTPQRDFRTYSIHAETLQLYIWRHHQVREVLHESEAYQDYPTILGGDFNTCPVWQRWSLWNYMGNLGWTVASRSVRGATFRGLGPIRFRLDHIFSRDAELLKAGKIHGGTISNHDFVWADFSL